jgi:hypothetical protein
MTSNRNPALAALAVLQSWQRRAHRVMTSKDRFIPQPFV